MFRTADLVLINKADLLPHLDYDLEGFHAALDAVNPGVPRIMVSARQRTGIDEWGAWLRREVAARRQVA